ncbi:hypothetical protein [Alteromonas abrolhosensis]|jgi:hypothetical protein|uniref:hypothetical protein n=1 Tax=Alteromonas abrolhosensis TaxID=1892904 RepID=UPI00096BC3FE|nr:hypothetical protein [Alteromonas abrolhosensis]|tara:strand:+ start:244 stop:660 length:417 start_codon:yes stop_codon:yes gene_type:complete
MKKLFKSTAFSIALVMIATAQAQQMNEHKHQASDKPKMQMGMNMSDKDMHMAHAKMKAMKEDVQAIKSERDPQKQREMMNKHMQSMMGMMDMMHEKMDAQPMQDQITMAEMHLNMMEMMMRKMTGNHLSESEKHSNQH